jgi:hypothetical protein
MVCRALEEHSSREFQKRIERASPEENGYDGEMAV